jgi:hypothetical protein
VCVRFILKIPDPEKRIFVRTFEKGGGAKKVFGFSFSF